jgi:antitoxin (DNA-binding transcriptional repressor) of toxin-antitoxin stability system
MRWAEVGEAAKEEGYVVLTRHGRPFAVLMGLDAEQIELGLSNEMWRFIRRSRRQKVTGDLRKLRKTLGI